jgi:hypothetical protein
MSSSQQQNPVFQEGRIALAINSYEQGHFKSLRSAAATYDVPRTTAQRCAHGTAPKRGSIAQNRCLTPAQEESLKQWILSMDQRGMQPRVATVRQMVSLLATQHPGA